MVSFALQYMSAVSYPSDHEQGDVLIVLFKLAAEVPWFAATGSFSLPCSCLMQQKHESAQAWSVICDRQKKGIRVGVGTVNAKSLCNSTDHKRQCSFGGACNAPRNRGINESWMCSTAARAGAGILMQRACSHSSIKFPCCWRVYCGRIYQQCGSYSACAKHKCVNTAAGQRCNEG